MQKPVWSGQHRAQHRHKLPQCWWPFPFPGKRRYTHSLEKEPAFQKINKHNPNSPVFRAFPPFFSWGPSASLEGKPRNSHCGAMGPVASLDRWDTGSIPHLAQQVKDPMWHRSQLWRGPDSWPGNSVCLWRGKKKKKGKPREGKRSYEKPGLPWCPWSSSSTPEMKKSALSTAVVTKAAAVNLEPRGPPFPSSDPQERSPFAWWFWAPVSMVSTSPLFSKGHTSS